MPFSTGSELKTAITNRTLRDDLTSYYDDWIDLAEADMQVRCKLQAFESSATVTVTSGSGTLPTDFAGARGVFWNGDTATPLKYITPDRLDSLRSESGTPAYYSVTGGAIKVSPSASGSVVLTYLARFTALTDGTANTILTRYPDVYLYGCLLQYAQHIEHDGDIAKYNALFDQAISRLRFDNAAMKYPHGLQVRPA